MERSPKTLEEKLTNYIEVEGPLLTKCRIWQGTKMPNGYGALDDDDDHRLAHRASYAFHIGLIPKGKCIAHRCDVRLCIRPDHLFPASHHENYWDMVRKGRRPARGKSKYLGVAWYERTSKWIAKIRIGYRQIHLGYFTSEAEAAEAYNKSILELGLDRPLNEIKAPPTYRRVTVIRKEESPCP